MNDGERLAEIGSPSGCWRDDYGIPLSPVEVDQNGEPLPQPTRLYSNSPDHPSLPSPEESIPSGNSGLDGHPANGFDHFTLMNETGF